MNTQMRGKKVLITGASSGIGREIATYLDSLGCQTVLTARREDKLISLKNIMKNETEFFSADLEKEEEVEELFRFCKEGDIKLDGLVHCAGMNELSPIQLMDMKEAKRIMNVNFFSFLQLGKFFSSKRYSNDGGSVVAMSGLASLIGQRGNGQYAASKAALNSAVKTMAQEFLKRRIRVNAILPNYVDTEMMRKAKAEGGISNQDPINEQPLGTISTIEIAYLTEYLLSDCSKSITGTLIPITSGSNIF